MRSSIARLLAPTVAALCIAPVNALTLSPVAMGQVVERGHYESFTGLPLPPGGEGYQLQNFILYGSSPVTRGVLEVGGYSGGDRYAPYWLNRGDSMQTLGWAAFQIPDLGNTVWLDAYFTGTYSNWVVSITDVNPTSFGSAESLFKDIRGTAYAQVPDTSPSGSHTATTWLGGRIPADILAQEGGLFYLGFVGPSDFYGPTSILSDMSLSVIPHPVVPVPAAIWLFGSAILGVMGVGARRRTRMSGHANAPVA
jgi:hypothetical protein